MVITWVMFETSRVTFSFIVIFNESVVKTQGKIKLMLLTQCVIIIPSLSETQAGSVLCDVKTLLLNR